MVRKTNWRFFSLKCYSEQLLLWKTLSGRVKNSCYELVWGTFTETKDCIEVIFINKLKMFPEAVIYSQVKVYSRKTFISVHSCSSILCSYNNPSNSRTLIGSRLWSIRGQTHRWRQRSIQVFLNFEFEPITVLC